jgi:hypothetical protein
MVDGVLCGEEEAASVVGRPTSLAVGSSGGVLEDKGVKRLLLPAFDGDKKMGWCRQRRSNVAGSREQRRERELEE